MAGGKDILAGDQKAPCNFVDVSHVSFCFFEFLIFITPASSATLKDLEVRGPGPGCSDPEGQPSNLLSQRELGAPLPTETVHTHPSPNDCSLYLSPQTSSNSTSLHAPQSRYQELEVALDSSSATINQLNENVESLRIGELEQAPSAVSMQQQEEDREMKEDIWTLRRRRCLSPCHASWRTWRAGRPWAAGERRGAEQRGKPVIKP
nr:golgin subfamily A member 8A-like [Macaca nemestrina]